jgi:hypothetical protein
VFAPTQSNPCNWEIKSNSGFNTFELRQGLFGYRARLNDYVSMDVSALAEESEANGPRRIAIPRSIPSGPSR